MAKKYSYVGAYRPDPCVPYGAQEDRHKCLVCDGDPDYVFYQCHYGQYALPDDWKETVWVFACRLHEQAVSEMEVDRNDWEIFYLIESGWSENPIWWCETRLGDEYVVPHLHVTPGVNAPPLIFSGNTSGLLFITGNGSFPVESREGSLVCIVYKDNARDEQDVSIEEAVKKLTLLRKASTS